MKRYSIARYSIFFAAILFAAVFSGIIHAAVTINVDAAKVHGDLPRYGYQCSTVRLVGDKNIKWITQDMELAGNFDNVRFFVTIGSSYPTTYSKTPIDHIDRFANTFTMCFQRKNHKVDPPTEKSFASDARRQITELKKLFPQKLIYIEPFNEPEANRVSFGLYKSFYRSTCQIIADINKDLPAGVPHLKIGGPTYNNGGKSGRSQVESLIKFVQAENLPLDFISYHEIGADYKVGVAWSNGQAMAEIKKRYGVEHIPTFITAFIQAREKEAGCAHKAAALLNLLDNGIAIANHWSLKRDVDEHKSYFKWGTDGIANPIFNHLNMLRFHKKYRIEMVSDGFADRKYGVSGWASIDSSGIAILVFNNSGSSNALNLKVANLPKVFSEGKIRMRRYLIDKTHSNYYHNPAKDKLERVEDTQLDAMTSFTYNYDMPQYMDMMILLEPTAGEIPVSAQGIWTQNQRLAPVIAQRPAGHVYNLRGRKLMPARAAKAINNAHLPSALYISKFKGKAAAAQLSAF